MNILPPRIRFADRADLPRLWELVRGLAEYERLLDALTGTPDALAEAVFGEGAFCDAFVADAHGVLVGYALVYPTFSSFSTTRGLWLEDLYVAPEARRGGAGRLLFARVARLARARGLTRVRWDVLRWNSPAIAFYEALGGRAAGEGWSEYVLEGAALERLAAAEGDPLP